jgi:hypothetical protein
MFSKEPERSKKKGNHFFRFGIIILFLGAIISILSGFIATLPSRVVPPFLAVLSGLGFLIGLPLIVTGGLYIIRGRKLRQASADEVIASSKIPPILYLRPFTEDEKIIGRFEAFQPIEFRLMNRLSASKEIPTGLLYEKELSMVLKAVGPLVAIGKPGDKFSPLGAARVYVSNEEWQEKFNELSKNAALILWVLGYSEGVRWELERLVKVVKPEKLIVCLPFTGMRSAARQTDWESFISLFKSIFPKPLPSNVGRALFMRFAADWTPQLVQPKPVFLDTFGLMWPRIRRGLQCTLDEMFIDYGAKSNYLRIAFDVLMGLLYWICMFFPITMMGVLIYKMLSHGDIELALIVFLAVALFTWRIVALFRSLR